MGIDRSGIVLSLIALLTTPAVHAIEADEPLLCAPGRYVECTSTGCTTLDAPRSVRIELEAGVLTSVAGGSDTPTELDHVERSGGKVFAQAVSGNRDGPGMTIAIDEATGDMVLSAAADAVTFSAFGACIDQ